MPDDSISRILAAVRGADPAPEFIESLRRELDHELSSPIGALRAGNEEIEDVTIEESYRNARWSGRRTWALVAAAAAVLAVVGLAALLAEDDPQPIPPVAPTTTLPVPQPIDVVREFVLRASVGDTEGAGELADHTGTLSAFRPTIDFIREIRMEVVDVDCVEIDAETVSCLADVVDDWARQIGYDSQARWTAVVEDGVIVRITEGVFSDDATTQAFFGEYLPSVRPEELADCGSERSCFADLVRAYAAGYAESEFYVEPTPLTLPEPGAG